MTCAFCFAETVFPASHSLLKERLRAGEDEITVCNGANLREALSKADVVIPMMTVLDEALMEAGTFRFVQQWGSGLEGVDLHAARLRGIWVANVPASGSNADSVAEHAATPYARAAAAVACCTSERSPRRSGRATWPYAGGTHGVPLRSRRYGTRTSAPASPHGCSTYRNYAGSHCSKDRRIPARRMLQFK
jgi:D-isomer specific 2-hydroxyacid dehydrogenase, catalytic domain